LLALEENDEGLGGAWRLPCGIFIGAFFNSGGCV
jgi:hypothetical protein